MPWRRKPARWLRYWDGPVDRSAGFTMVIVYCVGPERGGPVCGHNAMLKLVDLLKAVLPPTAIGKDYPYHGDWFGLTASRTGMYVSLGGYLGLTIGWIEGIELNFMGGVLGFDLRRPAIKLPGIGRLGVPQIQ